MVQPSSQDSVKRRIAPDDVVEAAIRKAIGNKTIANLLDLGTGSGAIALALAVQVNSGGAISYAIGNWQAPLSKSCLTLPVVSRAVVFDP